MRNCLMAILFLLAFVAACTESGYSRSDFEELIMGKTMTEVLDTVGKPNESKETDSGTIFYYHRRVYDSRKGPDQRDYRTHIVFEGGKAIEMRHEGRSGNVDRTTRFISSHTSGF